MKHKKLILLLSAFIISIAFLIHPYVKEKKAYENTFKEQIIRFHIKANSDDEEDQALKLRIRDEILDQIGDKFETSHSIEESREIILENLDNIKEIAEEEIKKEGKDYEVAVSLEKDQFPTRSYGDMVFPSGEYEALKLTIGEGVGKNWWCVMFPPLCFVDITHGVPANIEEDMESTIHEEEFEERSKIESEEKVEETEETDAIETIGVPEPVELKKEEEENTIKLKSKVVEMFERTKDHLVEMTIE